MTMATLSTTSTSIDELSLLTNSTLDVTTSFASTLPCTIEPLEELLGTAGITNSLLQALQSTSQRFGIVFHASYSFLNPLVQDNVFALQQLDSIVLHARELGVWEGIDILGREAGERGRETWCVVCGGEDNARKLRSRFFVEKYRVRVLIDAVTWFGLRRINQRSVEQERELQGLEARLGVVAERLCGVWRDYVPRLNVLRQSGEEGSQVQREIEVQMGKRGQSSAAPPRYEDMAASSSAHTMDEKRVPKHTNRCVSCSR